MLREVVTEIIKQLVPIILIVFVIPILLKIRIAVITYIERNTNSEILECARQIWNIVEEDFRLNEKAKNELESKADMFDSLLVKKFPYLTKEDLQYWRQSVAGEVNKDKEENATKEDYEKKIEELQKAIGELKSALDKDQNEAVSKEI